MNAFPDIVRGREPRPFRDWVLDARRLGFRMDYDFDPTEFKMWVRMKPISSRAKTAVDRYLQSSHPENCITCETVYDKGRAAMTAAGIEPPLLLEDEEKVLAFARDDTAAYAMRMAQEAMARG